MRHLIESLNTQIFYCELCNKTIPVTCDYTNIKNVMVHSDVDIEFELIGRVKCPNCSYKTSITLHPLLEDIIILLNKNNYTTIYSNIDMVDSYIVIKFAKCIRIPRKIRKNLPENWYIDKSVDKCYYLYTYVGGPPNNILVKLLDLEKFILNYMNKERN